MPYVATVNSNTPQTLEVVKYLKKSDFVQNTEQKSTKKTAQSLKLTPKEEELQEKIHQGLKELQDFRAGKIQLQKLEDFLNEI